MPGEKNKKYKEFIGLDLKFFSDENIIEIIKIIENSIRNDLLLNTFKGIIPFF